jgi:hypothetical protein
MATIDVQGIGNNTFGELCYLNGIYFPADLFPIEVRTNGLKNCLNKLPPLATIKTVLIPLHVIYILSSYIKEKNASLASLHNKSLAPEVTPLQALITGESSATDSNNRNSAPSNKQSTVQLQQTTQVTVYEARADEIITRFDLHIRIKLPTTTNQGSEDNSVLTNLKELER